MLSVSGDAQPGFAGIPLESHLVVRVLDVDNVPVPDAVVAWSVTKGGGSVTPSQSRSDASGLARTTWTLGLTLGEQEVAANIGGVEPILFTALASELGPTCGDGANPLNLNVGGAAVLVGNSATELCLASNPVSGTRQYVVVGFNSNRVNGNNIVYEVRGSGIVNPSQLPNPSFDVLQQPDRSAYRDDAFDSRIRQLELQELAPLVRGPGSGAVGSAGQPAASQLPLNAAMSLSSPVVGELLSFNTQSASSCSNPQYRWGRIQAVSQRAIVVADTGNPAGGFTSAEYAEIASTFDTLVYPLVTGNYGEPSDIDQNQRVVLFYTRTVNELTSGGSQSGFIAGYFFSRDLFPRQKTQRLEACPNSNLAEMMYVMVPDPQGTINGNHRSKDFVRRRTISTLAHEMQHLINSSRRLFINPGARFPERAWLDEGLAHNAEELLFYRSSGLSPRQNITSAMVQGSSAALAAFNDYQSENITRLRDFLFFTNTTWTNRSSSPTLQERGAATYFLRYVVDRIAGASGAPPEASIWYSLVNSADTGMLNLERVINADPMQWMRDWSVSMYVDDIVPGVSSRYGEASWNMRSIFAASTSQSYSLQRVILNNNVWREDDLRANGSVFYRFGVPAGGEGSFQVARDGGIPPQLSFVVVRVS